MVAEGITGKAIFFASGGAGYFFSRGLMWRAGYWAAFCLIELLRGSSGAGMEDVTVAMCLKKWGEGKIWWTKLFLSSI